MSVLKNSDSSKSLAEGELDVVSHDLPPKGNPSATKILMKPHQEKAQTFGYYDDLVEWKVKQEIK